jgi:protein-L-isoaspartate(D-aspartate) O-methyltransferase
MPDNSARLRRAYAARILRLTGVQDPRVEAAFAAIPREDFLGPPPWRLSGGIFGFAGRETDLAGLYKDVLATIDVRRGVNNGQPSLHAQNLHALSPAEGETVVQIGAGAGYYTAILAHLVGPSGKVIAYEIEADLAARAARNLKGYAGVEVRAVSGVSDAPPEADAIYVNAAATHPVRAWLEALKPGGRLLFPLQAEHSSGAMLLVTRPAVGSGPWRARFLSEVVFIGCAGAQDRESGVKLDAAFRQGGAEQVRWLVFEPTAEAKAWLRGDGWALIAEGDKESHCRQRDLT